MKTHDEAMFDRNHPANYEINETVLILNHGDSSIKENPARGKILDIPKMNYSTFCIGGGWEYLILINGKLFKTIGERNMRKFKPSQWELLFNKLKIISIMKHLITFPTWLIFSVLLTLLILIMSAFRREWDADLLREVWDYKDFLKSVIAKSK